MTNKKRILVTGADGFIGSHIMEAISGHFDVHTYSRRKSDRPNHIEGDICTLDTLDIPFDIVIHAAGNKSDSATMHTVNVEGTLSVLRYVKKHNAKLLAIGSGGIYGIYNNPDSVITAQSKYLPNNTYEKSKAEAQLAIENTNWPKNAFIVLHPTNVIGEGDTSKKLLNFFETLQKNKFYFLNKKAKVNYVYVKKIADIVSQILHKEAFSNKSYIVNDPITIEQLVKISSSALGCKSEQTTLPYIAKPFLYILAKLAPVLPIKFRKITIGRYYELTSTKYYSTEETNKIFPTDKTTDIQKGIHNLVAYYRENQWL